MDSMIIQELLISVLSIAALAGGTAGIINRDRHSSSDDSNGGKKNRKQRSKKSASNATFVPQKHGA